MEFTAINEEIISSGKDLTDNKLIKERFAALYNTGRFSNLRDLKWEFIRRSENKDLVSRLGKEKIYTILETLYNRKKV